MFVLPLLAVTPAVAQEKATDIPRLRKQISAQEAQIRDLRKKLAAQKAAQLIPRPVLMKPVVFPQFVAPAPQFGRVGAYLRQEQKYRTVLSQLDKVSPTLYSAKDPAAARRALDKLATKLVGARRALWELDRAKSKAPPAGEPRVITSPIFVRGYTLTASFPGAGNNVMQHKTQNPLLKGEYLGSLVMFAQARKALDSLHDTTAARTVLDQMERLLQDARRALWKREQVKKKAGK